VKAVIKPGPGVGFELANIAVPKPGPGDVLIEIKAASICGSDVPIYEWSDPWVQATVMPGQVVGHEFSGTVADVGTQVRDVNVGQLVTAEGHLACGRCARCRASERHVCPNARLIGFNYPGGMAEYISVPETAIRVSEGLSLTVAALQDPFGNAVHAVSKAMVTNANVLVTGCGPIGLMTVALARRAGARVIVASDLSADRCRLALAMGADLAVNPHETSLAEAVSEGCGGSCEVDVFFEMSGSPDALNQGFSFLRGEGTAILLGLAKEPMQFDFANQLITKGITVKGIIGRRIDRDWMELQRYLTAAGGRNVINLEQLVTHRLLLDEYDHAMNLMRSGACGKVVLFPQRDDLKESTA
jgi:threonine 3-dehydrogenase